MGECSQCSRCFTRNVVWWANLVFFACGLALIACGGYVYLHDVAAWAGKELAYASGSLGIFVVILSLLALLGAQTQTQKCAMWTYIALLSLLIIAQAAVVVLAVTMESKAKELLLQNWNFLTVDQRDEVMKRAECGIYGSDFSGNVCADDGSDCFDDCYEIFADELTSIGSIVMIVGSGVAALELFLLFCSFVLVCVDDEENNSTQNIYVGSFPQKRTQYTSERYCGGMSWVIGLTLFPCICFCPIDERSTRIEV